MESARWSSNFGPTVAIEVTPTENWLEIEAGVTPRFGGGQTEWSKPNSLSDSVEFMIGLGPEWVHTTGMGKPADSINGEAMLDFMSGCRGAKGGHMRPLDQVVPANT